MYVCECGKEFNNAQKFNGHKSHCKVHLIAAGKLEDYEIRKNLYRDQLSRNSKIIASNKKQAFDQKVASWLATTPHCEKCGKIMTEKYGSGRFCSRACANSREHSDETKAKLHKSLARTNHSINRADLARQAYAEQPKFCKVCGNQLPYESRHRKTCSDKCLHKTFKDAGISSSQSRVIRSKNEIYFYELCKEKFLSVKHNEPIFNGWDADIIIEDIKYAILWNGIWHYEQISRKQSLAQVQNRDILKLDEIKKCGYTPYVIKDLGKASNKFVEEQFNKFIKSLNM